MFLYPKHYDVIVIGGGHAGIEAAVAAARMGCPTLLLTSNLDTVGQMSCNPAIGGLAKGQLVREIDALGGEMGRCADLSTIHFRMLNTSKGPAVRSPRAQCDKRAYQIRMKSICEQEANLDFKQSEVTRLVQDAQKVLGVETSMGVRFEGSVFVVTTGTFLRGLMHIGDNQQSGGRLGDSSSLGITPSLIELGLRMQRFKTGTPPRLNRRTIDYTRLETQPGDAQISYFSHWNYELFHVEQPTVSEAENDSFLPGSVLAKTGRQLDCHITSTTQRTGEIIRKNLHKSPLYAGIIEGIGPRYCPSIEDKIVRFSHKEIHQLFLEPEGVQTDEIYINGLSTSLPYDVQLDVVRSVKGCERAEILRPAYAVEYDYADPTQMNPSLRVKCVENLFLAGQINGTSGYEEAAAQGIVAGINACRLARHEPPVIFERSQSYIGVLIDDLVTCGTDEPYRMFTSRAENRLFLRQDNADLRLSRIGFQFGLLAKSRFDRVEGKRQAIHEELERLRKVRVDGKTLDQLLKRPRSKYRELPFANTSLTSDIVEQVEIMIKYEGYLDRQSKDLFRSSTLERFKIPADFDFDSVPGLRNEARQKFGRVRPETLGQAARIPGVTPSDVSLISVMVERHRGSC